VTLKTVRYVGGLAVQIRLPTGRVVSLFDRDTVEVLPPEFDALIARTDFEAVTEPHVEPKEKIK
jgi:hypothetical protein